MSIFPRDPQAPTPLPGDADDSVATTKFVQMALGTGGYGDMLKSVYDNDGDGIVDSAEVALTAPWMGITGAPSTFPPAAHTHPQSDITNLTSDLALKAPLADPIFTGNPQAPTPLTGDNDTSIATTAFVKAQGYAAGTHTHAQADVTNLVTDLAAKAPLNAPVFTGDARAVTPATADNDTSIATTAFVKAQGYAAGTHTHAITDVTGLQAALDAKEDEVNKGVANGYASLDAAGKVPAGQLPSYVDDVQEFANLAAFPATGSTGVIYVALDTNKVYRWSGTVYVEISPSPGSSDAVPEGSVNLYYTTARSALKADLASPTFTGDPKAPTPLTADNDTSIATTAFVKAQGYAAGTHTHTQSDVTNLVSDLALKAPLASPALTGTPTAPTASPGTNTTQLATTAFVVAGDALKANVSHTHPQSDITNLTSDLALKAPLASPALTGTPTAPTAATATSTTQLATTAFVQANMALKANVSHTHAQADVTNLVTDLAAKAPLASPALTGNPTAPTPLTGDNDTSIATTAFVKAQGYLGDAPADGQQYARKNNAWDVVAAPPAPGGSVTISDTPPIAPSAGDLWWESDSGITYIWFTDVDSSQWVQIAVPGLPDLTVYATLADPVFTGDPRAPTPATADNDTSIATTAFVKAQGYVTAAHTHAIADVTGLQAALDAKEPTIGAGTTAQYWRGDKSWQTLDKAAVGLGNVDNTSDANKPVSTAQQTALNLKANIAGQNFTGKVGTPASAAGAAGFALPHGAAPTSPINGDIWTTTAGLFARINSVTVGPYAIAGEPIITAGTTAQYWRGDKSWQTLDKAAVGLANVDNTSDANKPVSTATQTALNLKADLASPTFTGDPKAPTPLTADNDTSIATTAFVQANMALKANATHTHAQADVTNLVSDLALKAPLASPALTGTPTAPTATAGTNTTQLATTAFVTTADNLKANLASPTFTGVPAAPTAATATNTTQLATTAFVQANMALKANASHTHPQSDVTNLTTDLAAKAPLASPALTGTPTAPTAAPGTNTTQIATTAFVEAALLGGGATVVISDTAPPAPTAGDLWWESDSGITYIWYDDGDSAQWVQIAVPGLPDLSAYATLADPVFTGNPRAPTPATADDDTSIATTAFVKAQGYANGVHTHVIADVTGLQTALDGKEPLITAGTTAQYRRGDKTWQTLDKTAVGLANVDNTSDANKPVSTAQAAADALKANIAGQNFTGKVGTLASAAGTAGFSLPHGAAPTSPINGDVWTTTAGLYARINSVTVGPYAIAGEPIITAGTTAQYWRGDKSWQTLDKTAVGLANVDNTSDANKPVSTATQTALNGKEATIAAGTTAQYWRGDKSWQTLDKAAVGLGNVTNAAQVTSVTGTAPVVSSGGTTPAISMPAATTSVAGHLTAADWNTFNGKANASHTHAQADVTNLVTDLAAKAPLASPALTGAPTVPTAATATNTTQVASTAFVQANMALKANASHTHAQADITNLTTDLAAKAPLASPALTGTPTAPTPATADSTTTIATTAHVQANMALKANASHTHAQADVTNLTTDLAAKAPLASPALTGTPTAPTATAGTNTTQLATTAFVTTADNLKANLASPTFTGVPAAPTAATATNTTQLATTAFVQANMALKANVSHTHAQADVTNLTTDLAAKAPLASPALTGTPTAPTAPAGTSNTQLATTKYVDDAVVLAGGGTAALRNRISNPAFDISQENGTTSGSTNGYYPADEWVLTFVSTGAFAAQVANNPTPYGSHYRLNVGVSTADASLAATERLQIRQSLEGALNRDMRWGSASAKKVVLRFGFNGPAGTYAVSIHNDDYTRSYIATFTSPGAGDNYYTLVIPGDTTGTWLTTNGAGLRICWNFGAGSSLVGVAGWQASASPGLMVTAACSNGLAAAPVTYSIFDVGLYVAPDGDVPPKFEVPSLSDELARMQRYYQKVSAFVSGYGTAGAAIYSQSFWPVTMRTTPSTSVSSPGYSNASALAVNLTDANMLRMQANITAVGHGYGGGVVAASARL